MGEARDKVIGCMAACLVLAAAAPAAGVKKNLELGLKVPPGFEVTEYAGDGLATDIYSMALDPRGRIVVAGRGYIRILVDDDGDGRADRALDFAAGPKDGAQGLWWERPYLYYTGGGGLWRYRVAAGGDHADGTPERILALRTGDEHAAHAIRRGPDGWLYVLCGNMTGIGAGYATMSTSPIREPVAGCVLRLPPDLRGSEVVADGFRNAYRMDFNADGELFTFDSDNERCVSLPWYEPTRFYHVIPGGHHGWQAPQHASTWRWPPYFADVVAPAATLGRGSPTGVICYHHTQFPAKYRGGMFLLDWTFGRVYFAALERAGASYRARPEVFLEAVGDNGFAPTDAVVHPDTGDLYVSIGGRGTRGAVYRVRYVGSRPSPAPAVAPPLPPYPLEWRPGMAGGLARDAASADPLIRLRALVAVRRHADRVDSAVVRAAVRANWDHPDRYVRNAAADLIPLLAGPGVRALGRDASGPLRQVTFCLGTYRQQPREVLERAGRLLRTPTADGRVRLEAVRIVQLALGDLIDPKVKGTVFEGYSARRGGVDEADAAPVLPALRELVAARDPDVAREAARTLAVLADKDPGALARVAERLGADTDSVEEIHYLIVLSRLRAPRPEPVTRRVAAALLGLDGKLNRQGRHRDRNWPLRVAELHAELARRDPNLNAALLGSRDFGRPDHVLFTRCPGFDRARAAELFLTRAAADPDYPWNPALVDLVGQLPEERSLPVLRKAWEAGGLEDAIVPYLARHPRAVDRGRFVQGLGSPQLATVERCLAALVQLPARRDPAEILAMVRALRRLPPGPEAAPLRGRLAGALRRATGETRPGGNPAAWVEWFARAFPDRAAELGEGGDIARWRRRLAGVDWAAGRAERGRPVFVRAACASCHSGGQALGPDLRGVTGRFSRDDLFTAVLQPSKDIAPRYRAHLITTADGKVYQGLVVYEAVDGLLLQTGPAATVRIDPAQIVGRRFSPVSLMPAGLLDPLSDRDIADLYAYLKSLGTDPKP